MSKAIAVIHQTGPQEEGRGGEWVEDAPLMVGVNSAILDVLMATGRVPKGYGFRHTSSEMVSAKIGKKSPGLADWVISKQSVEDMKKHGVDDKAILGQSEVKALGTGHFKPADREKNKLGVWYTKNRKAVVSTKKSDTGYDQAIEMLNRRNRASFLAMGIADTRFQDNKQKAVSGVVLSSVQEMVRGATVKKAKKGSEEDGGRAYRQTATIGAAYAVLNEVSPAKDTPVIVETGDEKKGTIKRRQTTLRDYTASAWKEKVQFIDAFGRGFITDTGKARQQLASHDAFQHAVIEAWDKDRKRARSGDIDTEGPRPSATGTITDDEYAAMRRENRGKALDARGLNPINVYVLAQTAALAKLKKEGVLTVGNRAVKYDVKLHFGDTTKAASIQGGAKAVAKQQKKSHAVQIGPRKGKYYKEKGKRVYVKK